VNYAIQAGGTIVLDPSDERVILFDWDDTDVLASGVEISSSTYTITAIRQSGTALTKDNESIVAGNRKTQARLLATTASIGDAYWVSNKVTTNEVPAQKIEQRYKVLIQDH
jgi:hypothetical protein